MLRAKPLSDGMVSCGLFVIHIPVRSGHLNAHHIVMSNTPVILLN